MENTINNKELIEKLASVQEMHDLKEIRNLAETTLAASCACNDVDTVIQLESGLEDAVNQYNLESQLACYKAAKESENPMHYAVLNFFYPAIRVKEVKDKATKRIIRSIADGEKQIDLLDLHKWVKGKNATGGIGADHAWTYAADKLNIEMAKDTATRYNDQATKSRLMDPTNLKAKTEVIEFKLDSKSSKKQLGQIIKMMLGEEYEVTQMDWDFVKDNYVSDNKKSKLGVKLAKPQVFVSILKKVCYRVLTNSQNYEIETALLKKLG